MRRHDEGAADGLHEGVTAGQEVAGSLQGPAYYAIVVQEGSFDIVPRHLDFTASGVSKIYDGTPDAQVLFDNLTTINGDKVTVVGSAAFTNKNAELTKTITITGIHATGPAGANYETDATATAAAEITTRALHISAAADPKTYDGSAAATARLSDDRVQGDQLTLPFVRAAFSDKNAGLGKAVTVSGITPAGLDAANYTALATATTSADINKALLTIAANAQDKTYDGNTTAQVTLSVNPVNGDTVTASGGANFADRNAGAGKTITVTDITLSGADVSNYTLANDTATATASITPRTLTPVVTVANKVYDATSSAVVSQRTVAGLPGDEISLSGGTAVFVDKNAGTQSVNVTGLTLSGPNAGNYTIAGTARTLATITPAPLTIVVDDKSMTQGVGLPLFTAQFSGLVGGETDADLDSLPAFTTDATSSSAPGSYGVTLAASDQNYTVTVVDGTLTVVAEKLSVSVNGVNQATANASGEVPLVGKLIISSSNPKQVLSVTLTPSSAKLDISKLDAATKKALKIKVAKDATGNVTITGSKNSINDAIKRLTLKLNKGKSAGNIKVTVKKAGKTVTTKTLTVTKLGAARDGAR